MLDASLHAADGLYALVQLAAAAASADADGAPCPPSGLAPRALRGSSRGHVACPLPAAPYGAAAAPPPPQSLLPDLCNGRATSSLMTHHDAITGTAYVSCSLGPPYTQCNCYEDYMQRMANATIATESVAGHAKGALLSLPATPPGSLLFGNATAAAAGLSPTVSTMVRGDETPFVKFTPSEPSKTRVAPLPHRSPSATPLAGPARRSSAWCWQRPSRRDTALP